jgi:O-antigen ligase
MEKMLKNNTMNNGTQITRIQKTVIADLIRNPLNFVKQLLTDIRGLRVKPAMTGLWILIPFLLALSTVFVVSNELANGVVSGKYFWFYGSMGLMSLITFIAVLVRKVSFRFFALDGMLLLFAVSVYLPALLFNEAIPNTSRLTLFTLLLVFYFNCRILSGVLKCKPVYRNLFYGFIILTGLVEAIWGLRQLYGFAPSQHSLFKLTGSFFNSGPYAGYLAMVFPLALHYLLFRAPCTLRRVLAAITCLAILLVLPASMSRASWIAVIAGSVVVIYKKYPVFFRGLRVKPAMTGENRRLRIKSAMTKRLKWVMGIIAVLFLLSAFTGMYFLKKDSADGRALTWKVSLQLIVKHPFGVGLGNFPGAYGEEQAAYFASGKASETEEYVAGNPEYGFNEYLQIAVESGIIGLLLFVGIIVFAIRNMIKASNRGALGSLLALLVFAGFSYPFSLLPFLIFFTFLLAVGQWNADDADQADKRGFLNKWKIRVNPLHPCYLRSIVLALCCLLITAGCLWKQYPAYGAYQQWKNNQIYYQTGIYEDTAETYGALYPYLNERIQFLFEYAHSLSKAGLDEKQRIKAPARCDSLLNKSNDILRRAMQISCDPMLYNVMGKNCQAMKQYEQAEACYLQSARLVPSRLYPWYLLTKLYDEMGLKEKVRETADIVLTKEPKVQSPAIREMREEARKLKDKN